MQVTSSIHIGNDTELTTTVVPFTHSVGPNKGDFDFVTFRLHAGPDVDVTFFVNGDSARLYEVAATMQRMSNELFDVARDVNEQELEKFRAEAEERERRRLANDREFMELHEDPEELHLPND
jgi:hypothetical protein